MRKVYSEKLGKEWRGATLIGEVTIVDFADVFTGRLILETKGIEVVIDRVLTHLEHEAWSFVEIAASQFIATGFIRS